MFYYRYYGRVVTILIVYVFRGVKDSAPSLVWVRARPAGMDPHMLAVLLGARQAPQLAAISSVTEPFHRPFLSRFCGRKIPIEI
jgi:hypothetical protein